MKAVLKNTIVSLLCLASVVLAAPTQSMSHRKASLNTQKSAINPANDIQDQTVTGFSKTAPTLSIEEARYVLPAGKLI